MPFLKVGLPVLELDGVELAPQDLNKEVPASSGRLQEAGVDALGFTLYEIEHRLDHPRGCKYLSMIGYTLL